MYDYVLDRTSNVLVTGVTGLIGGEIVRRLAQMGSAKIWALIRPQNDADVHARLRTRMERSGDDDWPRVEPVAGDITRPLWAMGGNELSRITRSVDVIIHSAADTSFLCKQGVRDTNVLGVENLIE